MSQRGLLEDMIFIQYLIKKLYKEFEIQGLGKKLNTTQLWVLAIMSQHDKMTMSEICKLVVLEKGSFKTTIDLLSDYGYIQSEKAADDKRKIYLSLTTDGAQVAQKVNNCLEDYLHRRFNGLDDFTRQNILNAIHVLAEYAKELI
ncbi:MarR family winged helix-turn-helix transcriptional regulator [Acetivibrio sp. MSJd-27]|jgi:transcriptional regulator|uniref:MarR family winged helix-turn-helix transcriptional regulator n=1 Tax=Acetivibrio sp. MSJd-27 TaxID=2841523 RepID=UPI0015B1EA12|nr:transcriptional regulator [Acetivibrio sp. MSJd-27]MBU5449138.1 transcriptional regulator [Acetivibrio sp. MSJd-27]